MKHEWITGEAITRGTRCYEGEATDLRPPTKKQKKKRTSFIFYYIHSLISLLLLADIYEMLLLFIWDVKELQIGPAAISSCCALAHLGMSDSVLLNVSLSLSVCKSVCLALSLSLCLTVCSCLFLVGSVSVFVFHSCSFSVSLCLVCLSLCLLVVDLAISFLFL